MNELLLSQRLPVLALRGLNVFPAMTIHFDVGRKKSVRSIEEAMRNHNQEIFLVTQKDIQADDPDLSELYSIGTVCTIKQILKLPGDSLRILVGGKYRARITECIQMEPYFYGRVETVADQPYTKSAPKVEAMIREAQVLYDHFLELTGRSPQDGLAPVLTSQDPGYIADYITQNSSINYAEKQKVLAQLHPMKRLELALILLGRELDILQLESEIQEKVQESVNKGQRDYYLREQLRVIQSELGEGDDEEELQNYHDAIVALQLPEEITEKLLKELKRLSKQPSNSSEAAVLRTYLDTCLELPWNTRTKERVDIRAARKVLDEDHFGLEKVKERILEIFAVRKMAPELPGQIICLVGPPGVGKTSVAISIARALNRNLARISLGGVHDEADIRGHRKTYIGAMPGRLVSGLIQAGSMNPVMVLDEIDKLGSDYRGDPSAALLEALDSEQNCRFRDNYLEVPIDLSDVLFITTANTTDTIPRPLLDRMEVITLTSYTDEEKLQIAKRHLLPKQRKKHGLTGVTLKLSDEAIREIISLYTRESGVRILERELAAVCRKCAAGIAKGEYKSLTVRAGRLEPLLGPPKYKPDAVYPRDEVGLVRGLAWTSVGGEVLDVEVGVVDGVGKLELTGNLGSVMQESCKAAITYIRSRADKLGIDPHFNQKKDIHIHFPEGAVPKDGPSAGITICIGVISALTGIPVRRDLAMTGEITLRGRILPIGGLKEKTMAALRAGVSTVIIPAENEPDLDEIDQSVRERLKFVTADHVDAILDIALNRRAVEQEKEAPAPELPAQTPPPGVMPEAGARIGQ